MPITWGDNVEVPAGEGETHYPTPAESRPYTPPRSMGGREIPEGELDERIQMHHQADADVQRQRELQNEQDAEDIGYEDAVQEENEARQAGQEPKQDIDAYHKGIKPSRIILGAVGALLVLQQLAGASIPFGGSAWKGSPSYPYQGDCFKDGSPHFTEVKELLQSAVAPSWTGTAADGYTTANSSLMTQVQTMANLDLELEKLVQSHAEIVSQTQLGIGVEQDVLIVAFPIILCLESRPESLAAAYTAAVATAAAAVGAAVGLLSWCLGTSIQTQQTVNGLSYDGVIAAAQKVIHDYASARVTQPGGSVASDTPVSGGVSVSSAVSGTPTVASSPGSASGVGPQRAPLNATPGEGQGVGVDSPWVAATPDEGAPVAPAGPMPGVAQVSQPSGQAANRSGGVASPSTRVDRQGQQGAPEEAVRAGEGEDSGAGLATPGVERAPIDVAAAGPDQAPAPTPTP
jgi:hypothetical protein